MGLCFGLKLLFVRILSFLLLFNNRFLVSISFGLLLGKQHLFIGQLNFVGVVLG
jgi:hypothetical protein